MAWIKVLSDSEAQGRTREVFDEIRKARGKIGNIMRVQGLNPSALKSHLELYVSIMFQHSGLSRVQREMIATVVSSVNQCQYCVAHHAEALAHHVHDRQLVRELERDHSQVKLDPRDKAMLDYAVKLTKNPASVSENDIRLLRENGFSDSDILDLALIIGYFNFVNRLASGLGVEFDEEEVRGYKY